jgi:DNA modification methylase
MRQRNVHPFPARMAPDVAMDKIAELSDERSTVLDPMCGSGTVPRVAASLGRSALAADVDPLAVLMSRTACRPSWSENLAQQAEALSERAAQMDDALPFWISSEQETKSFCEYWFADRQRADLSRLARILIDMPRAADPLRLALSRLIVTKSGGASLARDTSHSRPHRVALENDFNVLSEFVKSARQIAAVVNEYSYRKIANIRTADARSLDFVGRASVDLVVTSPPYLNAIDYLRGHRLALVWLGWTVPVVRDLRSGSIGSESGIRLASELVRRGAEFAVPRFDELTPRLQRMVWRFARDTERLCQSMQRVVRPGGFMVLVVADSQLRGVGISNSRLLAHFASAQGFEKVDEVSRPLPQKHRYLPPPESDASTLSARMREEFVITMRRSA